MHFPRLLQYEVERAGINCKSRYQNMPSPCLVLTRADPGTLCFRASGCVCLAKAISLGSSAELTKLTLDTPWIKGQDWDWLTPFMGRRKQSSWNGELAEDLRELGVLPYCDQRRRK